MHGAVPAAIIGEEVVGSIGASVGYLLEGHSYGKGVIEGAEGIDITAEPGSRKPPSHGCGEA